MKKLVFLLALLLASPAWAVMPLQPIAPQQSSAVAGSITLTQLNLASAEVTWQTATTARYLFVFDATSLPGNGAVSSCSAAAGHVTGCWLWCGFVNDSTTAPDIFTADWTAHPIAARFGLVVAMSTGAGCGTFTTDGANNFFTTQAW